MVVGPSSLGSMLVFNAAFAFTARRPFARTARRTMQLQAEKKLLVLGGTGYLGQTVCETALSEGYDVVSLSRRGLPASNPPLEGVDYRQGDARQPDAVYNILNEGGFDGIVHCIGLLFDDASGLGSFNKFVSGSGSLPDSDSTYETITRLTAFHAIEAAVECTGNKPSLPFCFTSAAEAGWPEVTGGDFVESLMPEFIKRYMSAKRAVESKLMDSEPPLRPIIVRPSLIYSFDRPLSLFAVGTFTFANQIGLPFVDRPVTVDNLALAIVRAVDDESVRGKLRYTEIDALSA